MRKLWIQRLPDHLITTVSERADAAVGHGLEAHGRGIMVTERPLDGRLPAVADDRTC